MSVGQKRSALTTKFKRAIVACEDDGSNGGSWLAFSMSIGAGGGAAIGLATDNLTPTKE